MREQVMQRSTTGEDNDLRTRQMCAARVNHPLGVGSAVAAPSGAAWNKLQSTRLPPILTQENNVIDSRSARPLAQSPAALDAQAVAMSSAISGWTSRLALPGRSRMCQD